MTMSPGRRPSSRRVTIGQASPTARTINPTTMNTRCTSISARSRRPQRLSASAGPALPTPASSIVLLRPCGVPPAWLAGAEPMPSVMLPTGPGSACFGLVELAFEGELLPVVDEPEVIPPSELGAIDLSGPPLVSCANAAPLRARASVADRVRRMPLLIRPLLVLDALSWLRFVTLQHHAAAARPDRVRVHDPQKKRHFAAPRRSSCKHNVR